MTMVSLKRSKSEVSEEKIFEWTPPEYAYGTSLDLGKDELEKLGIENLPEVGSEMLITARAKVTRVSESASEDGDESRGVTLQLTEMDLRPATDEASAAEKLYGKAK